MFKIKMVLEFTPLEELLKPQKEVFKILSVAEAKRRNQQHLIQRPKPAVVSVNTTIDDLPVIKSSPYKTLGVDDSASDNGTKRIPKEWIKWYNDRKLVQASQPDLYLYFKYIKQEFDYGNKELAERLIKSLRQDFDWRKNNWLIAGTGFEYETDGSLVGTIIHHYGSTIIKPEPFTLEIPVYEETPIAEVAGESKGLNYLQVSNGTKDCAEEIIGVYEFISGKKRNEIRVWTATTKGMYTRKSDPKRAAGFYFINSIFHVISNNDFSNRGCSREVSYTP